MTKPIWFSQIADNHAACWRISTCAVLCVVSPDRISTCAGRSWSELDTARYARSTRARCYLRVRGIASNLACNLLTLLCQNPGTKKRIRDGKEQSEFCGGSRNPDGTLKNPPGPPKSKGEIKARDAASKAKLQAKKDVLRLAFVTHRDALEKDDKWTGPRKYQDWLEEQGWAAPKASCPRCCCR